MKSVGERLRELRELEAMVRSLVDPDERLLRQIERERTQLLEKHAKPLIKED